MSTINQAEKLAKKHKKIFETFNVNPGGYLINNHEFYLVHYERGKKTTGCAVVSPQEPQDTDEYMEAFEWLYNYGQYASLLLIHASFRANINMTSFHTVNQFLTKLMNSSTLETNEIDLIQSCKDTIDTILRLQEELVSQYQHFDRENKKLFDGVVQYITKKDINDALELIGEVEYIQHRQLTLQYNGVDNFKQLNSLTNKKPAIKSHMNNEIKVYIKEFINSKSNLKQNIKKVTYQKGMEKLPKDLFKEVVMKETVRNVEKVKAEMLKKLRFPAI